MVQFVTYHSMLTDFIRRCVLPRFVSSLDNTIGGASGVTLSIRENARGTDVGAAVPERFSALGVLVGLCFHQATRRLPEQGFPSLRAYGHAKDWNDMLRDRMRSTSCCHLIDVWMPVAGPSVSDGHRIRSGRLT